MAPLLALAAKGPITRKASAEIISDHFQLSQEDREARIPSGNSTSVRNRIGWAMTFLTKATLIEKVAPRTYQMTDRGRAFLAEHPGPIAERDLAKLPGWEEAWQSAKPQSQSTPAPPAGVTPIEALHGAVSTINADLTRSTHNSLRRLVPFSE